MTEKVICPHCGLGHGIHQTICDLTGIDLPRRSKQLDIESCADLVSEDTTTAATRYVPVGGGGDPFAEPPNRVPIGRVLVAGSSFPLTSDSQLVIGRTTGVGVSVELPDNVSSTHAVIRVASGGGVTITDVGSEGTGSTNGTFLNGARIVANLPTSVNPGDKVEIGRSPATLIGFEA